MHIPPGERYAHSAIMLPTLQLCSLLMGEGGGGTLGWWADLVGLNVLGFSWGGVGGVGSGRLRAGQIAYG